MLTQTHFAVAKDLTEMFEEACVGWTGNIS